MDPNSYPLLLAHIVSAFPMDADLIERLLRTEEAFTSACEDFALVCAMLNRFSTEPGAEGRLKISEYATLKSELQCEIEGMLTNARAKEAP